MSEDENGKGQFEKRIEKFVLDYDWTYDHGAGPQITDMPVKDLMERVKEILDEERKDYEVMSHDEFGKKWLGSARSI